MTRDLGLYRVAFYSKLGLMTPPPLFFFKLWIPTETSLLKGCTFGTMGKILRCLLFPYARNILKRHVKQQTDKQTCDVTLICHYLILILQMSLHFLKLQSAYLQIAERII